MKKVVMVSVEEAQKLAAHVLKDNPEYDANVPVREATFFFPYNTPKNNFRKIVASAGIEPSSQRSGNINEDLLREWFDSKLGLGRVNLLAKDSTPEALAKTGYEALVVSPLKQDGTAKSPRELNADIKKAFGQIETESAGLKQSSGGMSNVG